MHGILSTERNFAEGYICRGKVRNIQTVSIRDVFYVKPNIDI
jgi:hypothetical protein